MGRLGNKLRSTITSQGMGVCFFCPGCQEPHNVTTQGRHAWVFDGNLYAPTLSPSVLVTSGHYTPGYEGSECWCTYAAKYNTKSPFGCKRCHSFIRAGQIQFLSDCSHSLAGQTVDLPDYPTTESVK